MNTTRKRTAVLLALLIPAVAMTVMVRAADTPGSEADPVVTKSYVDKKVSEAGGGGGAFAPLEIKAGQSLFGGEGAEIILRSGEATAIGNAQNGVSDLTGGQDLMTGVAVAQNHLLLIPRDDGRGIKAATDAWVMVRGAYSLK